MNNIVIVDATNLFLRCYAASPALDMHGTPCGGIQGTLLSLRKILKSLKDIGKIIFVWDGAGGSKKRRAIVGEYKQGRKPVRLNRNFEFEKDNIEENMMYQRVRLGEYLSDLPINQVIVPDIEADDVISYLCQYYEKERKIIISNDKDFVQLLNANTIIYSTSKKELVASPSAFKEYGVHPKNFALARAMTGDKSDNLKGVGGVGLKTLIKLFPFFAEKEKITVDYFFEFCEKEPEKYKKFLDKKEFILNNYKVMRLDTFLIGYHSLDKILEAVNEKVVMNATSFRVKQLNDRMPNMPDDYLQSLRGIMN
jgi:5'-3' exonuclease